MINSLRIVIETLVESVISLFSLQNDDNFFTSRRYASTEFLTEPFQAPGNCDILLKLFSSSFLILAHSITNI